MSGLHEPIIFPKQVSILNSIKKENDSGSPIKVASSKKGKNDKDAIKSAIQKQQERFLELSQKKEQIDYKKLYEELLLQRDKEQEKELLKSSKDSNKDIIDQHATKPAATKVSQIEIV